MALDDDFIYPALNHPGLAIAGVIACQIEEFDCCVLGHMAKIGAFLQAQPKAALAPNAAGMFLQSRQYFYQSRGKIREFTGFNICEFLQIDNCFQDRLKTVDINAGEMPGLNEPHFFPPLPAPGPAGPASQNHIRQAECGQ